MVNGYIVISMDTLSIYYYKKNKTIPTTKTMFLWSFIFFVAKIGEFTSTDVKDSKITEVWGGTTCLPEQWKTGHSALEGLGNYPLNQIIGPHEQTAQKCDFPGRYFPFCSRNLIPTSCMISSSTWAVTGSRCQVTWQHQSYKHMLNPRLCYPPVRMWKREILIDQSVLSRGPFSQSHLILISDSDRWRSDVGFSLRQSLKG